jgi:hypothetical protein
MDRRNDPYYDKANYHMAGLVATDGRVSALCYKRPKAINLSRGQSWTIRPEAVTCPKCLKILRQKERHAQD